ncbi:DUF554 domain-containing protein [Clostridium sp. Marseille-P299]|uniref:DUF554 domain-containing protein n=1 Tax=Clostridium sp. Marseille-P299 TaxID=1805477 RepID=UPI000832CBD8|nr:DUF554 domain-containing protein [Clostridium sp. Marseille-P299]
MGTIANVFAVIIGGIIGLLLNDKLEKRFEDSLMQALGLCVIFIGAGGAFTGMVKIINSKLSTTGTMLMIISLLLGTLIGEIVRIEDRLEGLGERLKKLVKANSNNQFVEGFLSNTLVICVGAMAVVGSLNDGLLGDHSMLYAKAVLDAIITMVFAATLGIGTLFAALPLGIYQGAITVLSRFIAPYLNDALISDLSFIGSILIFGVGINLAFGKKFKVGNMLPAILVPVFYHLLFK